MSRFEAVTEELRHNPRVWLVTGVAGFIGSHLLATLLSLDQVVIGVDDYSTGYKRNLDEVLNGRKGGGAFHFVAGDLCDEEVCRRAVQGVDFVLHQAGLESGPRSVADPVPFNRSNVDGFVKLCLAAREAGVRRLVYASTSAVYRASARLPHAEDGIGACTTPAALTKRIDEQYAELFRALYGFEAVGLRYFHVYGPRQDPSGSRASVVPRWTRGLLRGEPCRIHGDGESTRDFVHVDDVVQANLLAAVAPGLDAADRVLNVGSGRRTSLNRLFQSLCEAIVRERPAFRPGAPIYGASPEGEVRHMVADLTRARRALGYEPTRTLEAGVRSTVEWYLSLFTRPSREAPDRVVFPSRSLRVSVG